MNALTQDQVTTALAKLPAWSGDQSGITVTWTATDFRAAMAFMQDCVEPIEAINHHPEWHNVYNRISITLRTHDAGDVVTQLDIDLATTLSGLSAKHGLKN